MKTTLDDEKVKDKISEDDQKAITDIKWLDSSQPAKSHLPNSNQPTSHTPSPAPPAGMTRTLPTPACSHGPVPNLPTATQQKFKVITRTRRRGYLPRTDLSLTDPTLRLLLTTRR